MGFTTRQAASEDRSAQEAAAKPSVQLFNDERSSTATQLKQQQMMTSSQSAPLQRAEDEELLQGKFATAQLMEEEEPLQGKFVAQRVEEEEPLQGKFATAQLMEEEEPLQGKFEPLQRAAEEEEPLQGKFSSDATAQREQKPNHTGMPDNLKSGIENLSGYSMDDVKVHYNSAKPAQLNAHAYAQGTDIHVAPGQEQHLPHEAWHVVQQKQGRVKPTMQMKAGVPVNDDAGLENEADVMGAKALGAAQAKQIHEANQTSLHILSGDLSVQRAVSVDASVYEGSVYIEAKGLVEEFKDGDDAGDYGWNGVEQYTVNATVGDKTINPGGAFNNKFIVAQSGHVLAQQNGGQGSDKNNVFAQDGGVNNGPYRSYFENPMRKALNEADDDDQVTFEAVLEGEEITNGKLEKESKNLFV